MKLHAQPAIWTHHAWPEDGGLVDKDYPTSTNTAASQAEACRQRASGSLSTPMRIVGILAFCQTIFFFVLFLFICARAGAATGSNSAPHLGLSLSTYTTKTPRDPFGSEVPTPTDPTVVGAAHPVGAENLKLMGILYSAASPAALVNNQLVELNKPVKIQTAQGEAEVKAVVITREMVRLEVGGQKVELRLGGGERDGESK